MARAHGHARSALTATVRQPNRRRRLRPFSEPAALRAFNDASARQAQLSLLTHDLASNAAGAAVDRDTEELQALAAAVGAALELPKLREESLFGLHSELRIALSEGRRLTAGDIKEMASRCVRNAALWQVAHLLHAGHPELALPDIYATLGEAAETHEPAVAVRAAVNARRALAESAH